MPQELPSQQPAIVVMPMPLELPSQQPAVSNRPARKPRPSEEVLHPNPKPRPSDEELAAQRSRKKEQEILLRKKPLVKAVEDVTREQGIPVSPTEFPKSVLPNIRSHYQTIEEERLAREQAVTGQFEILRRELPHLLRILAKIPDPRQANKCRHRLAVLMLYGLLMFVFQFESRREVNRDMTRPQFEANLKLLFPELETMPHADTLYRLLRDIDLNHLEDAHIALVQRLIRGKKFRRYLIQECYPIAIDGSQKISRGWLWGEQALQRKTKNGIQYYVYILEASLSFRNGMVIPLLSEFLEYGKGDSERNKQDCELRAFHRLSERLHQYFPRLPILLLLDGLYANGPVMQRCHQYDWQFMIVFKDKELSSVWTEFEALKPLHAENRFIQSWGRRQQCFTWVNNIDYEFTKDGKKFLVKVHVVICEEEWKTVNHSGEEVTNTSRHAWLSSNQLKRSNLHERCNLGARYRWGIEAGFLVEKHQGYHYEHSFALNWNAMKGYHILMRMGHLFNTLARFSRRLSEFYKTLGVRPTIKFIRETCSAPWLNAERVLAIFKLPFQLRLE